MSAPVCMHQDLSLYTLSATSTNSAYPLANLQTYFARDQWRSNSTAGGQSLIIDFGAAKAIDFIVIENHNFAAAKSNQEFPLEAADDAAFSVNVEVPVLDLAVMSDPDHVVFTSVSRRYWRIYFGSSALNAVPQLGQIFLGSLFSFGSEYEFGAERDNRIYKTSRGEALDGSIRTAQAFAGRKRYRMQFKAQSNTVLTNYLTFLSVVRGSLRPFYFLDADGTTLRYLLAPDNTPISADAYNLNSIQSLVLESQQVS